MKKVFVSMLVLIAMFAVAGCEKGMGNDSSDKSRSFECTLETEENDEYAQRKLIVSVDGDKKVTTYNVYEQTNSTNEEAYNKICEEKKAIEKGYEEKKYEHMTYDVDCRKENFTVVAHYFYDVQNLTEEEKSEITDVTKYVNKDGAFDDFKWTKEQKDNKYKCE